jgi:hypothetical protein
VRQNRKPQGAQASKRLAQVCSAEGLQCNDNTLQALAESCNGDIRLMLGQLQMIRLRKRTLTYDEAKVGACLCDRYIARETRLRAQKISAGALSSALSAVSSTSRHACSIACGWWIILAGSAERIAALHSAIGTLFNDVVPPAIIGGTLIKHASPTFLWDNDWAPKA